MEYVRNRLRLEFFEKDDIKNFIKPQSKLTFNRTHKPHENCGSFICKKNEVLMDKPVYLGFAV